MEEQEVQATEETNEELESTEDNTEASEEGTQETEQTEEQTEQTVPPKTTTAARTQILMEERKQVDAVIQKLGLPKEIEHIYDQEGNLRFVIPINGKKYTATPSEVVKGFNLNQAGYQKLEQGKNLEKEMKAYFAKMKEDPNTFWELGQQLGLNIDELAKMRLEQRIKEAEMTPEQREYEEFQRTKEKEKAELEQIRSEKLRLQQQTQIEQHQKEYATSLVTAMQKHGFTNHSEGTKSRIMVDAIQKMQMALNSGQNLTAEDAVFLAKQEWQSGLTDYFKEIGNDHISKLVPEDIIRTIRQADIKRIVDTPSTESVGGPLDLEEYEQQPRQQKKQTTTEFFEKLGG